METLARELSRALAARGDEVHAVHTGERPYDVGDGIVVHQLPGDAADLARDVLRRRVPWPDVLISLNACDVVLNTASVALRRAGVPHLVALHPMADPFDAAHVRGRRDRWLRSRWLPPTATWAARHTTVALFHSEHQRARWTEALDYRGAVQALWLAPVDGRRFRPSEEARRGGRCALGVEGRAVVGTVGRLVEEKDLPTFLRAVAELARARPEVVGCVVGDGPARAALTDLTRALRLQDHVRFLGPRDDVERILPALDVFALASREESLGIAAAEAMASGVPVVLPELPGPRQLAEDGAAHFFRPGDAGALAARVEGLLADPAAAAALGARGRRRARAFDPSLLARTLTELVDSASRKTP